MIIFDRRAGTLTHAGSAEPFYRGAWSGYGTAHNDPAFERDVGVGPLPAGDYDIGPLEAHHGHLGPAVMVLTPRRGTNVYGRSAFFIHGNDGDDIPYNASHGCLIAPKPVRLTINTVIDRVLRVA